MSQSKISRKHTYDGSESSGIDGLPTLDPTTHPTAPVTNQQLVSLLAGFQALVQSSNSIAFSANTPSLKVFESEAGAITLSGMNNNQFNITNLDTCGR